jgi:ketosteroid isomerase-like protein
MSADDVLAIHKLLADYNHLIDAGEGEDWADTFADGATFDPGSTPPVSGREALVAFAQATAQMVPGARHLISNISVEVTGDTATSRCYLQLWMRGDQGPFMPFSGRYADRLVRTPAGWRFAARTMTPD